MPLTTEHLLCSQPGGLAHVDGSAWVCKQACYGFGKCTTILLLHEQASLFVDNHFWESPNSCGYDWSSHECCL
jgi:hypothetical protein